MNRDENQLIRDIARPTYVMMFLLFVFSLVVLFIVRSYVPYRFRNLFIIVLPFTISYLSAPFIISVAKRLDILDYPNDRKMHVISTPLLGGLAIFLAFVIGAVATLWYSIELKGVVYASTMIFFLGLFDDIFKLSSIFRLIVQLLAVFVLLYHGLEIHFLPDYTQARILGKILTVIWIIGITNAVNFLDGLDGLCAGFGAITSLLFGIIAFLTQQYFLMFLSFSLTGSCFGFLPWNFRKKEPARIFLGDSGSLFIGFTLASFALMGDWAENNMVALIVPVLILILPIYDTSMTTFFRIKEGSVKSVRQWLDFVGKDHLHHRLYAMGIGKRNAVFTMYLFSLMLGFSAIIIRTGGYLEAYLSLLQAFMILVLFTSFLVSIKRRYEALEKNCLDADDTIEKVE